MSRTLPEQIVSATDLNNLHDQHQARGGTQAATLGDGRAIRYFPSRKNYKYEVLVPAGVTVPDDLRLDGDERYEPFFDEMQLLTAVFVPMTITCIVTVNADLNLAWMVALMAGLGLAVAGLMVAAARSHRKMNEALAARAHRAVERLAGASDTSNPAAIRDAVNKVNSKFNRSWSNDGGEAWTVYRGGLYRIVPAVVGDPTYTATSERPSTDEDAGSLADRHDKVKDEYAAIICDPLGAVTHSALNDTTSAVTKDFVLAMAKANDLRNTGGTAYADAVREVEITWTSARDYAARVGTGWLPGQDKSHADKAEKLLRKAADEATPDAERAALFRKAYEFLTLVMAFTPRPEAMIAIESKAAPALAAVVKDIA